MFIKKYASIVLVTVAAAVSGCSLTGNTQAVESRAEHRLASVGAIEELTYTPAKSRGLEDALAFDRRVKEEYASIQPGYIDRFTAVTPDGQVKVLIYWDTVADMDASQAKAMETELIGDYMAFMNPDSIRFANLKTEFNSKMSGKPVGAIEALIYTPAEGRSLEETLAFDQRVKDEYAAQQPGYIDRFTAVTSEGQVKVFIHWETVADMEASQAKAMETALIGDYMSFMNPDSIRFANLPVSH